MSLAASLLPAERRRPLACSDVIPTAAPLLLAIAGSSLTPLPCAFSLAGMPLGVTALIVIGLANDYTCIIMVRAASRLGVSGYEEVVLAAGGRRALLCCRAALVILLFGSMCGCMAAIQETSARALGQLGVETKSALAVWLSTSETGRIALLMTLTVVVLLPLSLASLGELHCVSLLGVTLMISISAYVVGAAISVHPDDAIDTGTTQLVSLPREELGLMEAASTFGYAFYVQPCTVPLLRTLPAGEEGASTLIAALHLTYAITGLAYLCVGLGGLMFFGEGHVPQDLLQGFSGRVGGCLAGVFSLYLMLCFSPTVVPLRETLVRLYYESSMEYFNSSQPSPQSSRDPALDTTKCRLQDARLPPPRPAILPPLQNAMLTATIVGLALSVAALMPNASTQIFALTGATGVCFIGYVFPIFSFWCLPEELGGAPIAKRSTYWIVFVTWTSARVGPALILVLGCTVSMLTLLAVFGQWAHPEAATTCEPGS